MKKENTKKDNISKEKKERIFKGIWFFIVALFIGAFVGLTSGTTVWGIAVGIVFGIIFFLIVVSGIIKV